jgi:hypothetical protein
MAVTSFPKETGLLGEPTHYSYADVISNPGPHTLLDITVPVNTKLNLTRAVIACRIEAIAEIYLNNTVIGSLRTGAAHPTDFFDFFPIKKIVAGENIKIKLMKRSGSPDVSIAAHLMGTTQLT